MSAARLGASCQCSLVGGLLSGGRETGLRVICQRPGTSAGRLAERMSVGTRKKHNFIHFTSLSSRLSPTSWTTHGGGTSSAHQGDRNYRLWARACQVVNNGQENTPEAGCARRRLDDTAPLGTVQGVRGPPTSPLHIIKELRGKVYDGLATMKSTGEATNQDCK